MIIAAVQMNSQDDKKSNIIKAGEFIDKAVAVGANIIVLPELFNFLGLDEAKWENAETIPGPTIEYMQGKARKHGVYILCGSILEKSDTLEDKLFNTSVFIDPEGIIKAKYRKIHLFDMHLKGQPVYQESATIQAGREVVITDTDWAKVGLSICYDLRFPELYRKLATQGARIIFLPAAFTLHTGKDHWETLIRARAIENQVYMIAAAQVGSHPPDKVCYGRSMIVDPWGIILAQAPDLETIIYADIDLKHQDNIRMNLPSLTHIRKDVFPY